MFTFALMLLACMTYAYAFDFPDCQTGPMKDFPICDPSLSEKIRSLDLVRRMNLTEKINNLGNGASGATRLGLPPYQFWSEALHGVADSPGVSFTSPLGAEFSAATSFPMPIGLGKSLWINL